MLCQFTFRNYRSYRDEAELSMQATPMREFERSLIECTDGQSFLPVAAVYGPNAGGKSNLLEALDYVRSAVARPVWLLSARADAPEGERPTMGSLFGVRVRRRVGRRAHRVRALLPRRRARVPLHPVRARRRDRVRGAVAAQAGAHRARRCCLEREGSRGLTSALRCASSRRPRRSTRTCRTCRSSASTSTRRLVKEAASWFIGGVFLNYNSSYLERALEQMLDRGRLARGHALPARRGRAHRRL